jgi:hypothetical protein
MELSVAELVGKEELPGTLRIGKRSVNRQLTIALHEDYFRLLLPEAGGIAGRDLPRHIESACKAVHSGGSRQCHPITSSSDIHDPPCSGVTRQSYRPLGHA